ncbi:serine hydrolase [Phenylobacterium sp.]|uniref:serine hydrolase domain-containing protein n=1 Tax=Phenylobacterium sp. TaxID=1871053 RepID=UPI0030F3B017
MTSLRPWLLIAATLPLAGCGALRGAAQVATGLASHQICSAAFVSRIDPEIFRREAVDPDLGPAHWLMRTEVDREGQSVSASLAGLATTRAVYRGPSGCLVLHGAPPPVPPEPIPAPRPRALTQAPASAAVEEALDRAFAEPAKPWRRTKAVVILRDGQIVGERYAPGYRPDTAITGWSATKSVTNALVGVLVQQGKLSADGPAPVAAWKGDSRRAISVDNLLRMTSGLALGDSLNASLKSAFDPSAVMLFAVRDMAGFAEARALVGAPGTSWTYADASPTITSRIIRDQAGGTEAAMQAFAHRELFDRLGMEHPTLELDATGTPLGASHMWASARDWARLGQLYLDDGVVDGERILPAGWADDAARPTPGAEQVGYGAGFWTNRGPGPGARRRIALGMPADAYFARGHQGQYVVIVPSARLVVVRLGITPAAGNDIEGVARLVAEAIVAVRPPE